MDHFQNQSDGNPIRTGGGAFGTTSGLAGTGLHLGGGHASTLHRSNSNTSSSSSSSEDDGHGGRRKKGLKQKIKEKFPGGHKAHRPGLQHNGPSEGKDMYAGGPVTTPVGGYGAYEHHQKKKGIMGKIKDKLPGHN